MARLGPKKRPPPPLMLKLKPQVALPSRPFLSPGTTSEPTPAKPEEVFRYTEGDASLVVAELGTGFAVWRTLRGEPVGWQWYHPERRGVNVRPWLHRGDNGRRWLALGAVLTGAMVTAGLTVAVPVVAAWLGLTFRLAPPFEAALAEEMQWLHTAGAGRDRTALDDARLLLRAHQEVHDDNIQPPDQEQPHE